MTTMDPPPACAALTRRSLLRTATAVAGAGALALLTGRGARAAGAPAYGRAAAEQTPAAPGRQSIIGML